MRVNFAVAFRHIVRVNAPRQVLVLAWTRNARAYWCEFVFAWKQGERR